MRTYTLKPPTGLVPITGNTYPVKERIKALGGTWSKPGKCWLVPQANATEAQRIVDEQADTIVEFRFSSGHIATRRSGGRCEDAPCCGCCTI